MYIRDLEAITKVWLCGGGPLCHVLGVWIIDLYKHVKRAF